MNIPNKTKYESPKLGYITAAQLKTVEKLQAKPVGISVIGVVKAASPSHLYLIDRHGEVTMKMKSLGVLHLGNYPKLVTWGTNAALNT